jgi:hypothetical protein
MASFFSKILSAFGSGQQGAAQEKAPQSEPQSHGEYLIHATPMKEGGQYRLAGRIEKQVDGETLVHNFVRADLFTSLDEANDFTFRKARLIIDQNGASLFADKNRG